MSSIWIFFWNCSELKLYRIHISSFFQFRQMCSSKTVFFLVQKLYAQDRKRLFHIFFFYFPNKLFIYQSIPSLTTPRAKPRLNFWQGIFPTLRKHKESANADPWGRKVALEPQPRGNYFKIQQRNRKRWHRNFEKQYWNVNMFRNNKTVKHKTAQSFLVGGFYGYSKYLKSFSIHL